MTLTASEYTFTQTFDANSENNSVNIKYDAKVIITSTPANGYDSVSYSGISTEVDENRATYFTVPADNFTLTATGNPHKYIITFNGNDGTTDGTTNSYTQNAVFNTNVVLENNKFNNPGYRFIGWATDETLGAESVEDRVAYTDGDTISPYAFTEDLTLYAVWLNNTYTITYNGNGGAIPQEEGDDLTTYPHGTNVEYDETVTLLSIDEIGFVRTGYTLLVGQEMPREQTPQA